VQTENAILKLSVVMVIRKTIQILQDAEGKITQISVPGIFTAKIINVDGNIEFRGLPEALPIAIDVLKAAFYSGVKESSFRMQDAGEAIFRRATVVGAGVTAVLYTVPPQRTFYFFGFDLDVSALDVTQAIAGNIFWNDGVDRAFAPIVRPANGGGGGHADNTFVLPILQTGWTLNAYSDNANTQVEACIFGVLV